MTVLNVPLTDQLAYSAGTYSNAGNNCGWTCLSMVWQYLTGKFINPDAMHDYVLGDAEKGYEYVRNLGTWVEDMGHAWRYRDEDADQTYLDEVRAELAKGHPVIVLVVSDRVQLTGGHWVVVTGWDGTYFHINNPWHGVRETWTPSGLLRLAKPDGKYWFVIDMVKPAQIGDVTMQWKQITLKGGTNVRLIPRLTGTQVTHLDADTQAWQADGASFVGDTWQGSSQWVFVRVNGLIGLTNTANIK